MAEEQFWETFQVIEEETDVVYTQKVAPDILDVFGIDYVNVRGGYLKNVDIKRADALSILKASLLEEYANSESSKLVEMCINEDGDALFYEVGNDTADIHPYYSIPSSSYIKPRANVVVTGAKPKQERLVDENGWYTLINLAEGRGTPFNTTFLNSSCYSTSLATHAVITYRDLVRHKPNPNWNDGITDLFELQSPFDRFMGFTWRITPPMDLITSTTKIYKQSQSSVPVLVSGEDYTIGNTENYPNLGIPKKRKIKTFTEYEMANCDIYEGGEAFCSSSTVPININMESNEDLLFDTLQNNLRVSKFLGVQAIIVIGMPLKSCYGVAKPGKQTLENNADNTALFISSYAVYTSIFKLNEFIDYTLLYDSDLYTSSYDDPGIPCIQFANNLRYNDNAVIGTGVPFYIAAEDDNLVNIFNGNNYGSGSILPSENFGGLLIDKIYAQITLDTPSFVIVDPRGNAAAIGEKLKVEVMPLIFRDEPSPIAHNGTLIRQDDGMVDSDPTTRQAFQETELEKMYNSLGSGRTLSLSFASLDEDSTVRLSSKLYNILSADDGKIITHTCPPTDEPKLGDKGPNGGIINSIEYSYTDQGSYLISVVEGPECFGDFSGIDGEIYYKKVDDRLSVQGTVIQDLGNHVQYVVHVDGIGPIKSINASANIISVRDRVTIAIYNNAVEK